MLLARTADRRRKPRKAAKNKNSLKKQVALKQIKPRKFPKWGGQEISKATFQAGSADLKAEQAKEAKPKLSDSNNGLKNNLELKNNGQVKDNKNLSETSNEANQAENKVQADSVKKAQTLALAAAPAAPQATNDSAEAKDATSFLNALKQSGVHTINVTGDFSLKDQSLEKLLGDITIKSKDTKHKIDFNNWHLDGNGHSVTFENIDLYDVAKTGLVTGATIVNFNNNVSFHGKTLLDNGATTVNFNGKVDAEAVKKYNFNDSSINVADDSSTENTALLNVNQNVNFRNGSNVTLTTTDTAVMAFNVARVEEGSKVTLNEKFTKLVDKAHPEKYSALVADDYAVIVDGDLTVNLSTQDNGQIGSFIYFNHINPAIGLSMGNGHVLFHSVGNLSEPLIDLSKNKNGSAIAPSNVGSNGSIELIAQNIGAYNGMIVNGDQLPVFAAKIHLVADGTGNIVGVNAFRGKNMNQVDIDITGNTNNASRAVENIQFRGTHGDTKWMSDTDQPNAVSWDNMVITFDQCGQPKIYSLDTYSKDQKIQPNDGHYLKRVYVRFVDTPNVVQITNGNFDLATDKLTGDITINPVIGNTSVDDAYIGVNIGKEDLNNKTVAANHYTITNDGAPVSHDTKYYIQPDEKMHFELDLEAYEDKITADAPITLKLMKEGYEFTATITLDQIKQAAKEAIEKARKDTEDRVGKLPFTGDDLKNENAQINKDAQDATDKITAATTIDGIRQAENGGLKDIATDEKKAEAVSKIDQKAEKVKKEVQNLSSDEKTKAETNIDTDAANAKKGIQEAIDQTGIEKAQNDGITKIDRDGAKAAIDNEAKKITQMIDGLPNIDSKTKQEADAQVEKDRQLYINNLDDPKQTSDQASIESVKKAGIKKIDDDGNLAAKTDDDLKKAKEDAKKEVDKAADQAKQNIDKQDLTPDEKQTAKDKVDADKKEAYDNIDKGTSIDGIKKAKDDGISKINKEQAKEEIEHEANKIKKEIDSDNSLSQEDKDKYKKQVDTEKTTAENNIDNATTTDQVDKAKNDGLKKIDREGAKAAIDNEANKVEKEIDSLKNIDEQTKQKAKDQVEADRKKYKDEIDDDSKTPTQNDVNKVRDEGIKKIDEDGKIATDADNDIKKAKDDAKKALEDEANRVKQEIDKDANLTPEEKEQAKAKVDADKNEAEAKIDKADNKADIEKAKNEGISKIDKEHAKAEIEHEARKIEKEIDGRDSLTQEEKDKYKAQTEADKTRALDNIDRANTSDEVNKAMNDGLKQIDREGAKAAIDNEANKIIKKIDGMSDVDEETKAKAKAQVEADRKKYKAEIDDESKTPTQEAVNSVRDEGIRKIDEDGNIKGKPKDNNNGGQPWNTKAKMPSGKQTASKKRQQSSLNVRAGSGARNESLAAAAGLAIAAAGSLLGLGIGKKRREK